MVKKIRTPDEYAVCWTAPYQWQCNLKAAQITFCWGFRDKTCRPLPLDYPCVSRFYTASAEMHGRGDARMSGGLATRTASLGK